MSDRKPMKPLSYFKLLVCLCFFISQFSFAYDTSSGGESGTRESARASAPEQSLCPTVLTKWVEEDFADQKSWGVSYASEAKTCQIHINSYQNYLKQNKRSSNITGNKGFSKQLSDKFKDQIHPSYQQRQLAECDQLDPEKARSAQTRFYSAASRIEAVNSVALDEISYYDSILPGSNSVLNGVECSAVLPDSHKKCVNYKSGALNCSDAKSKEVRLKNLVAKTREALSQIESLQKAHRNCLFKIGAEQGSKNSRGGYSPQGLEKIKSSCDPFLQVIEIKRNEVPWIRGETFNKIAVKKAPNLRSYEFETEYHTSDEKLTEAITKQVSLNRKALADTYKTNLEDFRCLTSSTKSDGSNCDHKKIRSRLGKLPELNNNVFDNKKAADRELNTYFEAEKCLLERGEDRANTRATVDSSASGAAITVATLGLGSAIAGIKSVGTASRVARLRQGLVAGNTGLNVAMTSVDIKKAYNSCSEETKLLLNLSTTSEVTRQNICSDPKSPLEQAREKESDCLVDALLATPGALPFAGAIPGLVRATKTGAGATSALARAVRPQFGQAIDIETAQSATRSAWTKTQLYMKKYNIENTPENQQKISEVFDGFLSRELTPLGPERQFRRDNGLRIVDAPFAEKLNDGITDAKDKIPDYIINRITVDHHNSFGKNLPKGTNSTTQILDMLDPKSSAYVPPDKFEKMFGKFASDNVGDGYSEARAVVLNHKMIRANPAIIPELRELTQDIDFNVFGTQLDLSKKDKLAAVLKLNDQTIPKVQNTGMDRVSHKLTDQSKAELDNLQTNLNRVLFPKTQADLDYTKSLANDFRSNISQRIEIASNAKVDLPSSNGTTSPIYFADVTQAQDKAGVFGGWAVVPQYLKKMEAQGVKYESNFTISGPETAPTRTMILAHLPARGKNMDVPVPGQSQAFVDAVTIAERNAVQARINSGELRSNPTALTAAQARLAELQKPGAKAFQTRDGALIFGQSYMKAKELEEFLRRNMPLLGH